MKFISLRMPIVKSKGELCTLLNWRNLAVSYVLTWATKLTFHFFLTFLLLFPPFPPPYHSPCFIILSYFSCQNTQSHTWWRQCPDVSPTFSCGINIFLCGDFQFMQHFSQQVEMLFWQRGMHWWKPLCMFAIFNTCYTVSPLTSYCRDLFCRFCSHIMKYFLTGNINILQ